MLVDVWMKIRYGGFVDTPVLVSEEASKLRISAKNNILVFKDEMVLLVGQY